MGLQCLAVDGAAHGLTADMDSDHLFTLIPSVAPLIGTFHTEYSPEHREQWREDTQPCSWAHTTVRQAGVW